jgi:hypothetical protein
VKKKKTEGAFAPDPYSLKKVIFNAFADQDRAFSYLGRKTCKTLGLYSSLEPSNLSLISVLTLLASGPLFPSVGCPHFSRNSRVDQPTLRIPERVSSPKSDNGKAQRCLVVGVGVQTVRC